ncbi:MAG: hypothetical protein AVO35_13245 [Candidatus Aegiribacteria sp. MLS_C]|nr:MAG: hypothetical protein AVO35_13245 [Candidatus Aegiribacteria sp. MLS_C]
MDNESRVRLTGLWEQTSKSGNKYLKGAVSPSSVLLILKNTYKQKEGEPDFVAYLVPPMAELRGE